jgi:hypothetical protein
VLLVLQATAQFKAVGHTLQYSLNEETQIMAWLKFTMNLTAGTKLAGTNLVAGTLEILDSTGKSLAIYNKMTSGAGNYQKPSDQ